MRKGKKAHTHPKGIRTKVNVIARLVFELAYYDVAVSNYTLEISFWRKLGERKKIYRDGLVGWLYFMAYQPL